MALVCAPAFAQEDPEKDYQEGFTAFRANDLPGAMEPLKRAADAGHAGAQALYGEILDRAELDEEAVVYLRKASEQGNADGQFALAVMYLAGEAGAPDDKETTRLMRAAAEKGHVQANIAMARAFIDGNARLGGDNRSDPAAGKYLAKAAEAGELVAMEALAKAYGEGGFGLQRDAGLAQEWRVKADKVRAERLGASAAGKK